MPVLNGSAAGRVITRYKTYTSYNVLHLVIRIFVTVNSFASDVLTIYGIAVFRHVDLVKRIPDGFSTTQTTMPSDLVNSYATFRFFHSGL